MNKALNVEEILKRAERDAKGDYGIYHMYKRMIEELELPPKEFEKAVRRLIDVLKV